MSDTPTPMPPSRRDEEIALEMMKFVAVTTGYGKTAQSSAGFQGGSPAKPEEFARQLIELYGQCLTAVRTK